MPLFKIPKDGCFDGIGGCSDEITMDVFFYCGGKETTGVPKTKLREVTKSSDFCKGTILHVLISDLEECTDLDLEPHSHKKSMVIASVSTVICFIVKVFV